MLCSLSGGIGGEIIAKIIKTKCTASIVNTTYGLPRKFKTAFIQSLI